MKTDGSRVKFAWETLENKPSETTGRVNEWRRLSGNQGTWGLGRDVNEEEDEADPSGRRTARVVLQMGCGQVAGCIWMVQGWTG